MEVKYYRRNGTRQEDYRSWLMIGASRVAGGYSAFTAGVEASHGALPADTFVLCDQGRGVRKRDPRAQAGSCRTRNLRTSCP